MPRWNVAQKDRVNSIISRGERECGGLHAVTQVSLASCALGGGDRAARRSYIADYDVCNGAGLRLLGDRCESGRIPLDNPTGVHRFARV